MTETANLGAHLSLGQEERVGGLGTRTRATVKDRHLLERAAAARAAIRYDGADPYETLALVIWPTEAVSAARRTATGRVRRESWQWQGGRRGREAGGNGGSVRTS